MSTSERYRERRLEEPNIDGARERERERERERKGKDSQILPKGV